MVGFSLFFIFLHHILTTNDMKYYAVDFKIGIADELIQDARDVLSALLGEAGFETFEETDEGLKGYVQRELLDADTLQAQLALFPFEAAQVNYTISEAEDRDWNEQWEQEGFEPIVIRGEKEEGREERVVIVHDGRHLPAELTADLSSIPSYLSIEIDAHLAFGTGTHETTRMMVSTLLPLPLGGKRMLDCGTGTGILAIAALKLGACEAIGYDIDEWSVDNARHNAVINQVDDRFTSLQGDASILKEVEGTFDIVMANINRNILLNDLPAFRQKMKADARLMLSGFYRSDITMLEEKAKGLGLVKEDERSDGDWACITLRLKG